MGLWWSGGPQEVGGAASYVIEAPTLNAVQRGRFQLTLTLDARYWTMQCICGMVNVLLVMLKFWFSLHLCFFFFLFFFLYRISRSLSLLRAILSYFHISINHVSTTQYLIYSFLLVWVVLLLPCTYLSVCRAPCII